MTKRTTCWFWAAALMCFAYSGCVLWQSPGVREQAASLPKMTCQELVRKGAGMNRFIQLTDVRLCSHGYAIGCADGLDPNRSMYVPIHSRQEKEPSPADLVLLLEVDDERNIERLLAEPDVGQLNCQVDRAVADIDPGFLKVLQTQYPGIGMANLRVVSVGLHEPTEIKAERHWRDAILAFVFGAAVLACWGWLVRY